MLLPLLLAACAPHIPEPAARPLAAAPDPPAPDAPAPRVCWIEFATGTLPHGLVVARGHLHRDVASTQSGLLFVDPRGTWLVDGGMALDVATEMKEIRGLMGLFVRQAAKGWVRTVTPADGVRATGVDPATLTGVVPTHAHFDHLGGLLDLPGVPVWLPAAEIDLAATTLRTHRPEVFPAEARALPARARAIPWTERPFLLWDRVWDLYGDGSVVLLDTAGHTPGSLSVHLRLADGRRVLLVGDTVWVKEGYELREPKAWLAGQFDHDPVATADQIGRLWALHRADPALAILPAHDRRVWLDVFGAPGCAGEAEPAAG